MSDNGQAQDPTQGLLDQAKEIERLGESIFRAAEGRRELPIPLGDTLKQIADLAGSCEEVISDHGAEGLAREALTVLATAFGAIRGSIDSVIVYQALEGTTYSTTTVAND